MVSWTFSNNRSREGIIYQFPPKNIIKNRCFLQVKTIHWPKNSVINGTLSRNIQAKLKIHAASQWSNIIKLVKLIIS